MHLRHVEPAQRAQRPLRVGTHAALVVAPRQRAHPGVEELRGACPGVHLGPEEGAGHVGAPVQQGRPAVRIRVHHGAGAQLVLRRTPLHQIGGQREGCPAECDEWGAAELRHGQGDCFADRRQSIRIKRRQPQHIRCRADRRVEHRPAPGHDAHVDARQLDRDHDVAEEDRGVDSVPPDRLQGDLAGELGGQAGIEHLRADPQSSILRQGAPGLPHEPHRRRLGTIAAVRADQRRPCRAPVAQGMAERQGTVGGDGGVGHPSRLSDPRWALSRSVPTMEGALVRDGESPHHRLRPSRSRVPRGVDDRCRPGRRRPGGPRRGRARHLQPLRGLSGCRRRALDRP